MTDRRYELEADAAELAAGIEAAETIIRWHMRRDCVNRLRLSRSDAAEAETIFEAAKVLAVRYREESTPTNPTN